MSIHRRPPSTLATMIALLSATIFVSAAFFGLVSFFAWLYLTPTLDLRLKWAIGCGIVAAISGAIARWSL